VIDVGITKATAFGKVYGLKGLEAFNGNYTSATAEGTIGGGAGPPDEEPERRCDRPVHDDQGRQSETRASE